MRFQIKGNTSFHVLIFMAAVCIIGGGGSFKGVAFIAKETRSIVKVRQIKIDLKDIVVRFLFH
jgi:hypothetical protein